MGAVLVRFAVAGILAGVAAGVIYTSRQKPNFHEYKPYNGQSHQTSGSSRLFDANCTFCKKVLTPDELIKLLCTHEFHKECLLAYFIVLKVKHGDSAELHCPIQVCKKPVPQSVYNSLIQGNRKNI